MCVCVQAGAPIQKLFPGVAGGPAFVKAVSAALPMLKINPTVSTIRASMYMYMYRERETESVCER